MQRRTLLAGLSGTFLAAPTGVSLAGEILGRSAALGRPVRAILVTSGKYDRYRRVLMSVVKGLADLSVVDPLWVVTVLDKVRNAERPDTADIWAAMAWKDNAEHLLFLPDGHYDYDFLPDRRTELCEAVLTRLREKGDVDLILTFGTQASQDMARLVDDVPVVSLASSDPVATGVIRSAEDSGKDNVHALVISDFIRRQVMTFHAVRPFERLGFICSEGNEKKFGLSEVLDTCRELGVECVTAHFPDDLTASDSVRFEAFFEALKPMIESGVRALMVPWFAATDQELARLVTYLTEKGVWTFSLSGPRFVSRGFLMGVGEESFEGYGLFEARVIKRIIAGEKPRAIGQVFVRQDRFSLNLRTAMQLGWKVPFELLVTADKTYTTHSIGG